MAETHSAPDADPAVSRSRERVLFVHAHPDDETIATGGTIATLVDRGAEVTVLTCTRGERGEVIPADLQYALASNDTLAAVRVGELAEAMRILGVTDHRFLGDDSARWSGHPARRYLDSGMKWGSGDGTVSGTGNAARVAEPSDESDPASLTAAPLEDVTSDIASVVIAVAPSAVVSYDESGGYGHPDHIRVHDAARRAADIYGVPFFAVLPGRVAGSGPFQPTVSVDVAPVLERKRRALGAYRSQLTVNGDEIVLSGGQHEPIASVERFQLLEPEPVGPVPFVDQHPASRFTVCVLAGVIGALFSALLSVYNQSTVLIAGQAVWVGVIVSIVITATLLAGLRGAFETRIVAGFAGVAMIAIVGVLSLLGGGGSVIIPWNGPGILWQISPAVIALVVLAWPRGSRARPGKIAHQGIVAASSADDSGPVPPKGP